MRLPFERFSPKVVLSIAGVAALIVAGAISLSWRPDAPPAQTETAVVRPARVMEISYGDATRSLVLAGTVVPRIESTLGFRVAGKIVRRNVDVGTLVQAGQVIAELDPADYRLSVDNARAALASAESDYVRAKADYERYVALRGTAAFMAQTLDTRQANAAAAQARVEQARSQLATAENNLGYTVLKADADGVVTAVQAEAGQVVSQGQGVVKVARTDELEIQVGVPEHRLPGVRKAANASFELWSEPGHHHAVRLRELSPSADPVTRTFPARFTIVDRPAFIGLGMTATLRFDRPDKQHVAQIPLSAVFQQGTQPAVWVVDGESGVIELRPVTIARWNNATAAVSSGLKDGELIATAGVHKLEAGQKVRPMLQQAAR